MGELELGSERPGPLSRVTASRLDALPRGLAAALAGRDALISDVRGAGKRVFVSVDTPEGKLFGRYSDDPADIEVFAHEEEARRIVGTRGMLRAPLVLDHGEGWLLEQALLSDRIRGAHAVDTAVAAVSRLVDLQLPRGPRAASAPRGPGRLQRPIPGALSPLPVAALPAAGPIPPPPRPP